MKKFTPLSKEQMQDMGIKRWQIFYTSDGKDGLKAYHLIMTETEKADDTIKEIIKQFMPMYKVEGFRYKIEILLSLSDAASFAANWDNL